MVPPEWIEHSTSPLPRVRSTTELRRQPAVSGARLMPHSVGGRNNAAARRESEGRSDVLPQN